jgi:plastocyanin
MRSWLLIPLLIAAPAALPAQQPAAGQVVAVQLSSFDFTPSTIRLHAGQPVTLRLTNTSSGGHNFAAREFFAAAQVTSGQNAIREGAVEVPEGQTVSVQLTPARGTYRLRCTHTLHSTFGMRGEIVVE